MTLDFQLASKLMLYARLLQLRLEQDFDGNNSLVYASFLSG